MPCCNLPFSRYSVSVERLKPAMILLKELDVQAVLYLRLMKRACNWGWRPTEGRQKARLKGYLLCSVLLQILKTRSLNAGLVRQKINPGIL